MLLFVLETTRYVRVAVGFGGKHAIVRIGVFTPQHLNEVSGHIVRRVVSDHAYHEYAVGLEIFLDEMTQTILADLGRFVYELHASQDPRVGFGWIGALNPFENFENVARQHEQVPEPDGGEDLLVEQIYGQHALHRVLVGFVRIANFADEKVAQRYLCFNCFYNFSY